jgi:hypothetical protein
MTKPTWTPLVSAACAKCDVKLGGQRRGDRGSRKPHRHRRDLADGDDGDRGMFGGR